MNDQLTKKEVSLIFYRQSNDTDKKITRLFNVNKRILPFFIINKLKLIYLYANIAYLRANSYAQVLLFYFYDVLKHFIANIIFSFLN